MSKTEPSLTTDKTLEETLSKLRRHPNIDAILVMGSTANQTMHEYSDYDLTFIVHVVPENILGITTYINNRFTEVFFYSPEEVETLLAKDEIDPDKKEGWIINWSRDGQIVVDKSGLLKKIKERTHKIRDAVPFTLSYAFWHKINYNFVQNMRYFRSGKEAYLQALDVRLLYSVAEVFVGYFNVRKITWRGEKQAIQWLQKNDVRFLKLFHAYLAITDRARKIELYAELVKTVLEPVGGVWGDGITSVMPTGDYDEETIGNGLFFWQQLLTTINLMDKEN